MLLVSVLMSFNMFVVFRWLSIVGSLLIIWIIELGSVKFVVLICMVVVFVMRNLMIFCVELMLL